MSFNTSSFFVNTPFSFSYTLNQYNYNNTIGANPDGFFYVALKVNGNQFNLGDGTNIQFYWWNINVYYTNSLTLQFPNRSYNIAGTYQFMLYFNAGNAQFDPLYQTTITFNNPSTITSNNPSIPCFKEDTKILTDKGYIPIQYLRKGDLVKTLKHDYKEIDMIGKREIYHPALQERIKDQLYKCSQTEYTEIFEPLIITGCHSILVENSDTIVNKKQIEKVIEVNGGIYLTNDKLRLPACVDERAIVYETSGNYTIYHIALENNDYYTNYGIYANGLLVESCSKRYLKELSNMTLIK